MHRPGLTLMMYEHLLEAGFDFEAARQFEGQQTAWSRPPLFTELELGGESLQRHLSVPTQRSPDELADVYERFVAGYIYTRVMSKSVAVQQGSRRGRNPLGTPSDRWLSDELGLPFFAARTLFVRPLEGAGRLGVHLNLVQFAALVAYNHPCSIEHGSDTFTVTSEREGYQFGVRGGRLVSNMKLNRREIAVRFLYNPAGRLADLHRGQPELSEPLIYDTLALWLFSQRGWLGQALYDALLLGVTILRWRSPFTPPATLRLLTSYERSRKALQAACAEARSFGQFDDPVTTLKGLFVPNFVTSQEFADLFGNPYQKVLLPVSANTRQRWLQAINSLDPDNDKEVAPVSEV